MLKGIQAFLAGIKAAAGHVARWRGNKVDGVAAPLRPRSLLPDSMKGYPRNGRGDIINPKRVERRQWRRIERQARRGHDVATLKTGQRVARGGAAS